jgi:pyruvate/2-oxoglutarate dehydrogenase complex dihydrolipoamide dehydrogenase (E3) component
MYDIVILGGGPAGVTAALRARELGATVALIERGNMGGTCTNDGCVPTRVLAKSARLMRDAQQFSDYGLLLEKPPQVDFSAVMRRTQQIVYQIQEKKQLLDHLDRVKVETFSRAGEASFIDPHTVQIKGGQLINGEQFVLCVGGSARRLPIPGGSHAMTHNDVWRMDKLPASIVIVGGGATGCQLASIFNAFGTKVTLIDVAPRILSSEDGLVTSIVSGELIRHGIDIITGIEKVIRINPIEDNKQIVYQHEGEQRTVEAEKIILSVGWPGNVDKLNLTAAGVTVENNYIKVNDFLQTSAPHIYAAGDITGKMMLVQSAGSQARVAAENALLGATRKEQHKLVPHGGFTDPEYGGVGLTEAQAREQANPVVAVVPYGDMDRAVIDGHPVGFCKLIVDRDTKLVLGAHVVGEQAVEVVSMVAAGITGKLTVDQVAEIDFAYPTFAAVVGLAAREIQRVLGSVSIAPEWRELGQLRGAEWERKD